jgi:hypothetical protein
VRTPERAHHRDQAQRSGDDEGEDQPGHFSAALDKAVGFAATKSRLRRTLAASSHGVLLVVL